MGLDGTIKEESAAQGSDDTPTCRAMILKLSCPRSYLVIVLLAESDPVGLGSESANLTNAQMLLMLLVFWVTL